MTGEKRTFWYEAMDNSGYAILGEVQATSENGASAEIKKLGLWTTWVRDTQAPRQASWVRFLFRMLKLISERVLGSRALHCVCSF